MNNPLPRIDPEFKALIPPLSPEEYAQLEQNILSAKKCRDAIVTWDGIIIDGHNRFNICVMNGIPFEIKAMNFDSRDEAMIWMLDNQLGRRNLSDVMKIELAMEKTKMLKQQAKENLKRGGRHKQGADKPLSEVSNPKKPINVRKAVANMAGVSEGTVHNYTQLPQQLKEAVKRGELTIDAARRLHPNEIRKQLSYVDKMITYLERHIPNQDDETVKQEIKEKILHLQSQIKNLTRIHAD